MKYYSLTVASVYGSCAYGSQQFNDSADCTTSAGTSTGSSAGGGTSTGVSAGGILSNTGFDFILVATVVSVIALAALVVRFVHRPAAKAAQAFEIDSTE